MDKKDSPTEEALDELISEPSALDKALEGAKMVTITIYYEWPEDEEVIEDE